MRIFLFVMLTMSLGVGCGVEEDEKPDVETDDPRVEGTEVGDCTDLADNDGDGLFDCDDEGCSGSPECAEADADADADSDGDADADADADDPDVDGDGVPDSDDCDDADASLGATAEDGDCDGSLTVDDCDDADAESTIVAEDGDCDAVLTADDCNDAEADSTTLATDGDCDTILTADDCNDADADSTTVAIDGDCDMVLTADDCDDADADSTTLATDGDCDAVPTADDCDDSDAESTTLATDGDCDTVLTADDCDDADAESTTLAIDGDCDTVLTADDCDDADADSTTVATDGDCDAVATADDCDDGDESSTIRSEDADCDSAVSIVDCDDEDSSLGSLLYDRDCDGAITDLDCDDFDVFSTTRAIDADCDGVLTAEDCDDTDFDAHSEGVDDWFKDNDCDGRVAASLSAADYSFVGENALDNAGFSVSSAGDVDGDGLDDLVVGAPYYDDGGLDAGKVYLILGASLGSSSTVDLSAADYSFVGENAGDYVGPSVSTAGDVDGDGLDDLLIGAPGNDDGGSNTGKIYLILGASLGSSSTIDLSAADYSFVGENAGDSVGQSVSSAGDVDGDGLDDLLVGASRNGDGGGGAGKVYLILGASLGSSSTIDLSAADYSFVGENTGDYVGQSVSSAGDVDGDGLDDILVGASGNEDGGGYSAGKAYLILGASLGSTSTIDLSAADYSFVGENAYDNAGYSVSSAGDVDGDGLDDLLVGAYRNGDGGYAAGKVYLILGASLGSTSTIDLSAADYSFVGENDGDAAGSSVSSAGDVDGDGLDDLLVGAPKNLYGVIDGGDRMVGKAYLILGASLGSSSTIDLSAADYSFIGEMGDGAASAISSAGDVNDDGLADFLVGASGNDGGGLDAGKVYLIFSGL